MKIPSILVYGPKDASAKVPKHAARRAARATGDNRGPISVRDVVMAGVSRARVAISARLVTGAAILAAVFTVGGTEQSWAQAPAPIFYKSSSPAASPTVRLEPRSEGTPIAVAPHARIPTFENSPNSGEAFDLRPGAVKASFGPAPASSVSRIEAPRELVSAVPAGGFA